MKKLTLIFLIALSLAAGLALPGMAAPKEINVSYVTSPFNLPSIVARRMGMWEKEFGPDGIKINFHKITSGSKQAQAMAGGSLDIGGVMNSTSVILANSAGNPVKIIAGYSRPAKLFAIVAKDKSIKSIADLKGKKVAGPKGTVLHQFLAAALASKGMSMKDVQHISMKLPAARTALLAGNVDAALLAASLMIKSVEAGCHIITTADGLVSPKLVITCRKGFFDENPEMIKRIIKVHNAARDYIASNQEKAVALGAKEHGVNLKDANYLFENTQFIRKLNSTDITSMGQDMDFLIQNGMLKKKVDLKSVIWPMALEK
jgi:sulfonate transport system substrate-binding protein